MQLLILAPHYDHFIKTSGDALAESFDKVTVVIPKWRGYGFRKISFAPFKNVDREFTSRRSNVRLIMVPRVSPLLFRAVKKTSSCLQAAHIRFDCVLSHFLLPYGYLGNKIAQKFNKPSLVIGHGFDVYDAPFRNPLIRRLIKTVLSEATHVATVSEQNVKCLRRLGFDKPVHVIPMGFDQSLFFPVDRLQARSSLEISVETELVLNVGNLVPIKNQQALIRAIDVLSRTRPNVHAYIIGDGPHREALQQTIDRYNVAAHVTLVGRVPHEELGTWYNAADVFVLPSRNEGNPCSMFEALACGVPCIGTMVGGVPEVVVEGHNGYLCAESENEQSFARLINEALNKSWDRNAIAETVKTFGSQQVAGQLAKLLSEHR